MLPALSDYQQAGRRCSGLTSATRYVIGNCTRLHAYWLDNGDSERRSCEVEVRPLALIASACDLGGRFAALPS
jgi:hypothetical protein